VRPYRVDVSSILEDLGASEEIDGEFPLDRLVVGDAEFTLVRPATVTVMLTNTGPGVVATGSVDALTSTLCSRCLEPFELAIEGSVEGFYVRPGRGDEIPEDQEVEEIMPDGSVDLAPALLAALTIETPFAAVHDDACAGLCPVCGCNLNVETCDCHEPAPEVHPFAALKDLLHDDSGER
jgi:uncharacterized protein